MREVSAALALVHEIRKFGEEVLGLDFGGSFQEVSKSYTAMHWLYVSYPDRIKSVWQTPMLFSWWKGKLLMHQRAYESVGCDTYLFSAEGHGGGKCPILPMLLKAPPERQAYVILHEGVHTTLRKNRGWSRIPYDLEESGGRLIGCMAAQLFAQTRGYEMLLRRTEQFAADWLKFCGFINWARGELSLVYKEPVAKRLQAKADAFFLIRQAVAVLRDEINDRQLLGELSQEPNNALFLRYGDYTTYYPLLLGVHNALGSDVHRTCEFILTLPKQKSAALRKLRRIASQNAAS